MEVFENPKLYAYGSNNLVVEINKSPFTIGRGVTCDYSIVYKGISREHCRFEKIDDQWFLRDISTNGTYLNRQLIKEALGPQLKDNDVIELDIEQNYKYNFALTSRVGEEMSDEQLHNILENTVLENIELITSRPRRNNNVTNLAEQGSDDSDVSSTRNNYVDLTEDLDNLTSTVIDVRNGLEVVPNATSVVVTSVPDELLCAICDELFVKATTLNCSHTFCKECIETWRSKSNRQPGAGCPVCRTKITSLVPSLALDNFIKNKCKNF